MGRILIEHRTIGSVTNNISYTYNLDGSTATLTYPSGRTITYTVSAAQRPQKAVDNTNSINYVLNTTYAPQGAVAGALLGQSSSFGGITYAATYTNRLLPYTVTASSSAGSALNLTFGYYANGNVQTITNNLNSARTQSFTYDNLNRVATAQSQATSGTYCWGQSFGYDRYANLLSTTVTQCTAPMLSLGVNANNQITNSGFTYDTSGDMTSDGTYGYAWDARHLLQSAAGVTYTYDGDGKRVMKSSGTLYWNMTDGTPLAETNASGTTLNEYIFFGGSRAARRDSSGNVYYYFQDHLGTTKTLTNSSGAVCYDADFIPFGYEMAYITTCSQNYKFTGLERDGETGLDHTLHRKYDSSLGRWLTPDRQRGDPLNPQSWNRYAYVLDNPINFSDPYGLTNWGLVSTGLKTLGFASLTTATAIGCGTGAVTVAGAICAGGAGLAAAGLGVIGLTYVTAGVLDTPGAQQALAPTLPLVNPLGLFTFAICASGGGRGSTCLDAAEAGAIAWDVLLLAYNLGTFKTSSDLSKVSTTIGGGVTLGNTIDTVGGAVASALDGNTVNATPQAAPLYYAPINDQLVEQGGGSDSDDFSDFDDGGDSLKEPDFSQLQD